TSTQNAPQPAITQRASSDASTASQHTASSTRQPTPPSVPPSPPPPPVADLLTSSVVPLVALPSTTTTFADPGTTNAPPAPSSPPRIMMAGLSPLIQTLDVPKSPHPELSAARIGAVEYLGSYNWLDRPNANPTIVVPGSPPVWKAGLLVPFTLAPDARPHYVDQNAHRMPAAPLAPLFAAVDALATPVDWPAVDFVLDLGCLRRLMGWLDAAADAPAKDDEFRVDLELVGAETVVMQRWEAATTAAPRRGSYGHSFEEKTTCDGKGCRGSTGHYRIVRYDFFGFSMVVRFQVDACIPKVGVVEPHQPASRRGSTPFDLDELLAELNLDPPPSPPASPSPSPSESPPASSSPPSGPLPPSPAASTPALQVVRAGKPIPHRALLALTTRTRARAHTLDWADVLPPLYLSAVPMLYVGVHDPRSGTFTAVHDRPVEPERRRLGAALEARLERLGRALEGVQEVVRKRGKEGGLSLVWRRGVMGVYRRVGGARLVGEDVRARFVAR
ncbi:hypothetical protein OF83DRAFT_464548, partial [Amylostereum chailletii]